MLEEIWNFEFNYSGIKCIAIHTKYIYSKSGELVYVNEETAYNNLFKTKYNVR